MKPAAAIPDALAVLPLVRGLDADDSPFSIIRHVPAIAARALADESLNTKIGLISSIDYARHAGSYRIVPGIGVSSRMASGVARVRVKPDARAIRTLSVDPRATAEVVLASVLIAEKFPAADGSATKLPTIVPVGDAASTDFSSCDAVLEYYPWPIPTRAAEGFSFDLYEEWADLTDLPWVSAMWVVREEEGEEAWIRALEAARDTGVSNLERLASDEAAIRRLPQEDVIGHLQTFTYDLGTEQQDSLREFFQYAFYLGILNDVPELAFFDPKEKEE